MAKQATRPARLSLEPLADRVVPAVDLLNGEILISGTPGPDNVTVSVEFVPTESPVGVVATIIGDSGLTTRYANEGVTTKYVSESGSYVVKVVENGGPAKSFPLSQVTGRVIFRGFGGDDYFSNTSGLRSHANGMGGNDILIGGWGNDYLVGGNGEDSLLGMHGNDEIYDRGTDFASTYINGGYGNDVLHGGNGDDTIEGEYGNDTIAGGSGTDHLFGHDGDDKIYGGSDTAWNHLEGGSGNDKMYGANGRDFMYGQDGVDTLYGRDGSDYLDGGDDDLRDFLYGGAGKDYFQIDWSDGSGGKRGIDYACDYSSGDVYYEA